MKNQPRRNSMKNLQVQLRAVVKSLAKLSKEVDKISKEIGKMKPAKAVPKKKIKKAAAKKGPAKRKTAKKVKARKTDRKVVTKKAPAMKTRGQTTVLTKVLGVIKKSKKGASIATLRAKTGLGAKQLSNALYKLSTKGAITTQSRGVYVKK